MSCEFVRERFPLLFLFLNFECAVSISNNSLTLRVLKNSCGKGNVKSFTKFVEGSTHISQIIISLKYLWTAKGSQRRVSWDSVALPPSNWQTIESHGYVGHKGWPQWQSQVKMSLSTCLTTGPRASGH